MGKLMGNQKCTHEIACTFSTAGGVSFLYTLTPPDAASEFLLKGKSLENPNEISSRFITFDRLQNKKRMRTFSLSNFQYIPSRFT